MDLVWEKLQSKTLVWGGKWEDVKSSVRAQVFGTMVELARDRVQFYISDLFHDALWINQELNGPRGFDWIVRESGTFIGVSVLYIKMDEWAGVFKYRFDVREDNGKWTLDIYEARPITESRPNVPDSEPLSDPLMDPLTEDVPVRHEDLPTEKCPLATTVAGCIYHPADICIEPRTQPEEGWNIQKLITSTGNPTRRTTISKPIGASKRKRNSMLEDLINSIQEKMDELETARQDAENAKEELDQFLSESEDAKDEYKEAIKLLERISLPNVSVGVSIDVAFES